MLSPQVLGRIITSYHITRKASYSQQQPSSLISYSHVMLGCQRQPSHSLLKSRSLAFCCQTLLSAGLQVVQPLPYMKLHVGI